MDQSLQFSSLLTDSSEALHGQPCTPHMSIIPRRIAPLYVQNCMFNTECWVCGSGS